MLPSNAAEDLPPHVVMCELVCRGDEHGDEPCTGRPADRVVLVGPIRQELLSGVREGAVFNRLRERLRDFDDEPLTTEDFEVAAQAHNACRKAGVAGSAMDFLICAVAQQRQIAVFTTDKDFERYASVLPIRLYEPEAVHGKTKGP